jgi:hypothetical protein
MFNQNYNTMKNWDEILAKDFLTKSEIYAYQQAINSKKTDLPEMEESYLLTPKQTKQGLAFLEKYAKKRNCNLSDKEKNIIKKFDRFELVYFYWDKKYWPVYRIYSTTNDFFDYYYYIGGIVNVVR